MRADVATALPQRPRGVQRVSSQSGLILILRNSMSCRALQSDRAHLNSRDARPALPTVEHTMK